MTPDPKAAATKEDIAMLMDSNAKMYDAMAGWKDELKEHFDVALENVRHDLIGANKDRIEDHEHRLKRLETQTGLQA